MSVAAAGEAAGEGPATGAVFKRTRRARSARRRGRGIPLRRGHPRRHLRGRRALRWCAGRRGLGRPTASGRRRVGGELLPALRWKRAVLLPFFTHGLLLFGRERAQRLVLLARRAPLIRRELGPGAHLLLHALLLGGRHLRIPLGDAAPLLLALRLERPPFGLQRREDPLLLRGEITPCRPRGRSRGAERRGQRDARDRENEGVTAPPQKEKRYSPSCFSQFWNPLSR